MAVNDPLNFLSRVFLCILRPMTKNLSPLCMFWCRSEWHPEDGRSYSIFVHGPPRLFSHCTGVHLFQSLFFHFKSLPFSTTFVSMVLYLTYISGCCTINFCLFYYYLSGPFFFYWLLLLYIMYCSTSHI